MCDHWTFLVLISQMILILAVLESIHALEKNKGKASNTRRVRAGSADWSSCTVGDRWLTDERPMFRRRMPLMPRLGDHRSGEVFDDGSSRQFSLPQADLLAAEVCAIGIAL